MKFNIKDKKKEIIALCAFSGMIALFAVTLINYTDINPRVDNISEDINKTVKTADKEEKYNETNVVDNIEESSENEFDYFDLYNISISLVEYNGKTSLLVQKNELDNGELFMEIVYLPKDVPELFAQVMYEELIDEEIDQSMISLKTEILKTDKYSYTNNFRFDRDNNRIFFIISKYVDKGVTEEGYQDMAIEESFYTMDLSTNNPTEVLHRNEANNSEWMDLSGITSIIGTFEDNYLILETSNCTECDPIFYGYFIYNIKKDILVPIDLDSMYDSDDAEPGHANYRIEFVGDTVIFHEIKIVETTPKEREDPEWDLEFYETGVTHIYDLP